MNNFLKRLFFVRKCLICGRALPDAKRDTVFCPDCMLEYLKLCGDTCFRCGKSERECRCVPGKLQGKVGFAAHLFTFNDSVSRTIVYSVKLQNLPYLQRFIAGELSDLIYEVTDGKLSDYTITFVPRKPKSVRLYGFDQAKVLAELFAERLHVPCVSMFRHARLSKLQKRLRSGERAINAKRSYSLLDGFVRETDKLLIFDDVMTTGSTLSVLIALAKSAGFHEVSVVCIAKTIRN